MENPASWNFTTKLISSALDYTSEPLKQALKVKKILDEHDTLIKETFVDVVDAISKVIQSENEALKAGYCGLSLPRVIHDKLSELKVINKT